MHASNHLFLTNKGPAPPVLPVPPHPTPTPHTTPPHTHTHTTPHHTADEFLSALKPSLASICWLAHLEWLDLAHNPGLALDPTHPAAGQLQALLLRRTRALKGLCLQYTGGWVGGAVGHSTCVPNSINSHIRMQEPGRKSGWGQDRTCVGAGT